MQQYNYIYIYIQTFESIAWIDNKHTQQKTKQPSANWLIILAFIVSDRYGKHFFGNIHS